MSDTKILRVNITTNSSKKSYPELNTNITHIMILKFKHKTNPFLVVHL